MGWLLTMYSGSPSGPYLSVRRMPVTSSLALNTVPSDSSYTFHLSGPTRSKSTEVVFVLLGSIDVGGGSEPRPRCLSSTSLDRHDVSKLLAAAGYEGPIPEPASGHSRLGGTGVCRAE